MDLKVWGLNLGDKLHDCSDIENVEFYINTLTKIKFNIIIK